MPLVSRRRRRLARPGLWFLALLIAFLIAANFAVSWAKTRLVAMDPSDVRPVDVIIPSGASAFDIGRLLRTRGVVRDERVFNYYARYRGLDQKLKSGEYELTRQMNVAQILDKLTRGQVVTYSFTVPEGFTVIQVADLLAKKGYADRERFLAVARSPELSRGAAPSGVPVKEPLEGHLFPETYQIQRGTTEEEIVKMMMDRLETVFKPEYRLRAQELGLSLHQVLTLASIIEKEATAADRDLVSAVFHNRLKRGMKLDSCATLNYVIENPKLILTNKDLETPSPYNTYKNAGLPPGPIANPGEAAIRAALWPAKVDYLYFVVKPDETQAFATTYEEHLANRARYQSAISPGSQP